MPTVGEQLRGARERARLSVHDLANALNMKADQVRALEESQWSAFSAPVYIRGFVRTVSRHLKLDTAQLIQEIEAELAGTEDYSEAPSLTVRRKGPLDFIMLQLSRIRWAWALPALLGALMIAAVLYGLRQTERKAADDRGQKLGSGIYEGRRGAGALTLPLPTNPPAGRR